MNHLVVKNVTSFLVSCGAISSDIWSEIKRYQNLLSTSGVSILFHGVISFPEATLYDTSVIFGLF